MKKIAALVLTLMFLCVSCVPAKSGVDAIKNRHSLDGIPPVVTRLILNIGGDKLQINQDVISIKPSYEKDGVTLVPLRAISEGFGAEVGWDGATSGVTITKGDMQIKLTVGDETAYVNGIESRLLHVPELNEDTTMVPLRFISENLGSQVSFDAAKQKIVIVKREESQPFEIDYEALKTCQDMILSKIKSNAKRIDGQGFPEATKDGIYNLQKYPSWVGGFYTGLNYICYDWSGDEQYVQEAKKMSAKLKAMLDTNPTSFHHDLGFTFMLSYYQDYLKTGSEESKNVVIKAADVLKTRINDTVGYVQGWNVWGKDEYGRNNQYRMIVDSMCNVPILFTASEITGDSKYKDAAIRHVKATQQYLVREDFTTPHTFVFDAQGNPKFQQTHQGAYDTSCWSRGQSWVINGMALAYEYTGDKSFLQTAIDCADTYFIMTDTDLIPRWDFVYQNNTNQPKDSSAASISACGMMDIWEATGDEYYKNMAYKIWTVLYENYSTINNANDEGIITQATGHKPNNQNINVSLIYGDYYFAQLTNRFLALQ